MIECYVTGCTSEATHDLYVANLPQGTVSLDLRLCDAHDQAFTEAGSITIAR